MNRQECLEMIGEEVKSLRGRYQPPMTQTKLAKKIKKTNQAISNIESAQNFPSIETLFDIAQATGTNLIVQFRTDEQIKADKTLTDLILKRGR